jgi:hypothetical protein
LVENTPFINVKVTAELVPPPGAGVVTSTGRFAAICNCAAGTVAVSAVGFQYNVGTAVLPISTTD